MVTWTAGGVFASLVALAQSRALPRPAAVRRWVREYGLLARAYVAEVAVVSSAAYAGTLALGALAGVAAAGTLRAATTLLGPAGLWCSAGRMIAISELARTRAHAPRLLMRRMMLLGAPLVSVVLCWGLIVSSLPGAVGASLVGGSWQGAQAVLPLLTVALLLDAAQVPMAAAMRALEAIRVQFVLRVFGGLRAFTGLLAGAACGGAQGAAIGLATAAVAGVLVTVPVFLRVRARAGVSVVPVPAGR